jgi:hypothetical protein
VERKATAKQTQNEQTPTNHTNEIETNHKIMPLYHSIQTRRNGKIQAHPAKERSCANGRFHQQHQSKEKNHTKYQQMNVKYTNRQRKQEICSSVWQKRIYLQLLHLRRINPNNKHSKSAGQDREHT